MQRYLIMDVKFKKKFVKNQDGQAMIEMILFLPLLILLFIYLLSISASINGAINQQKITRGYFFSRLKNNSMYPFAQDAKAASWSYFGMSFIGWREKFKDGADEPVLPCYLAKVPFFSSDETSCNEYQGTKTNYIRVGTVFGVCGANYHRKSNDEYQRGIDGDPGEDVASWGACTIKE